MVLIKNLGMTEKKQKKIVNQMNNLEKENFLILGAGNMGICFVKALLQSRIKVNRIKTMAS